MRTTLGFMRFNTRLPESIGKCVADLPGIAGYVNEAILKLLQAGGDSGWYGTWQRAVFNITCNYLTLPRRFARAINLDVCRHPIRLQNEFYELLPGGPGLIPGAGCCDWCGNIEGYDRGMFPTLVDITSTNQLIRVYPTDPRDVNKRVLITGLDQNSLQIYSEDGLNTVNGFYLTLAYPFVESAFIVTAIQSIQKDVTYGDVPLYQVDSTTGAQVALARFAPDEINPSYRRYWITKLPLGCCVGGCTVSSSVPQITALCKLEIERIQPAGQPLELWQGRDVPADCLGLGGLGRGHGWHPA